MPVGVGRRQLDGAAQRRERRLAPALAVEDLALEEITVRPDSEITALIAYLQRLGTDIYKPLEEPTPVPEADGTSENEEAPE